MTRIEAEATIPAGRAAIWEALVDHERWPEWHRSAGGAVRLEQVELLSGAPGAVGARRRCTARFTVRPAPGARTAVWTEFISDVTPGWSMELESSDGPGAFERHSMRLTLLPRQDGQTRLRWRVTYQPRSLAARLLDRLFIRRAIARCLEGALAGLAEAVAGPATAPEAATPEPTPRDASPAPPDAPGSILEAA